jgi:hypothetical protein
MKLLPYFLWLQKNVLWPLDGSQNPQASASPVLHFRRSRLDDEAVGRIEIDDLLD